MSELGLPLSLAVELQSRNLRLDSSLWTARHTNGGYSVSFFWPSPRYKRRRRRRPRKPQHSRQAISNANNPPCESHSVTYISGPPPNSSKPESLMHTRIRKEVKLLLLQPRQLLQQVMKILLFMNRQVLKKTSLNLLLNLLGQTVSSSILKLVPM